MTRHDAHFPKVREALAAGEMENLGEALQNLGSKVPNRPHLKSCSSRQPTVALGPATGATGRLGVGIRGQVDKGSVETALRRQAALASR